MDRRLNGIVSNVNKRQRTPKGQPKTDNPDKPTT